MKMKKKSYWNFFLILKRFDYINKCDNHKLKLSNILFPTPKKPHPILFIIKLSKKDLKNLLI